MITEKILRIAKRSSFYSGFFLGLYIGIIAGMFLLGYILKQHGY